MPAPSQANVISADWVKWVGGLLVTLNSICVGYVVKMETRVATLETSASDHKNAYEKHLQDNKEIRADIYARLKTAEDKQAAVLESINAVRVDVAAIRGALGIKRHTIE